MNETLAKALVLLTLRFLNKLHSQLLSDGIVIRSRTLYSNEKANFTHGMKIIIGDLH